MRLFKKIQQWFNDIFNDNDEPTQEESSLEDFDKALYFPTTVEIVDARIKQQKEQAKQKIEAHKPILSEKGINFLINR